MAQDSRRRTIKEESSQREKLLRPREKSCREKTRDFFWDKEEKTCLTRTFSNWLSISFYYALFLAGVFLIFYLSMYLSNKLVSQDPNKPQYILGESPVGSPCVSFFPLKGSRNLIWLSKSQPYDPYVDIINRTFKKYKKANKKFNPTIFGECSSPPFGYDKKTPCLFFRLNRMLMWTPTPWEKDDEDDFPEDMPEEVKTLIEKSSTPRVWLSCNGTTAKDRDHITPDFFHVIGEKGFDVAAFPFKRQKNYTDSIIAIKLVDSKPRKVLYSFTCSVWTKEVDAKTTAVDVSYYIE